MNTPIRDFLEDYRKRETLRLHMPGHKGRSLLGFEELDITEIDGADVLYSPHGMILESEKNAAKLFHTARTVYSAEGSSLSIRAMLYLACLYGKSRGKGRGVVASRNAHKVFMSACALLDLSVEWLYGDGDTLCARAVTEDALENTLTNAEKRGEPPFAVYLTSPDYLGNTLDIAALSAVCHRHGALCLVDNAHGAYLGFLPESRHPMSLGADMCADSAHKTLPALTGAAYLHISQTAPRELCEGADSAMSLFASTSPSYLILSSLDAVNGYLADGYSEKLSSFALKTERLKKRLMEAGYELVGDEPLKLTIRTKSYGYYGFEIGDLLMKQGIVCELSDRDYCVMMLTPELCDVELEHLARSLCGIEGREPIAEPEPWVGRPERAVSIREALMSPTREIGAEDSEGMIYANATLSCPPAVPILVSGERIDREAVAAMKYYGIERVSVL